MQFALDLVSKILAEHLQISQVPLWLEYHGRVFKRKRYFDCIGDFTQYIPISLPLGGVNDIKDIESKVSFIEEKGVNFLELLANPKFISKYPEIQRLLPISRLPYILQQEENEEELFPTVIYHNQLLADTGNMVADSELSEDQELFSRFIHVYTVDKDNKLQLYIR